MKVLGNLTKQGKHWGVEIPLLNLDTQGTSRANALVMAKSVVEDMVNKEGFSVEVLPIGKDLFFIDAVGESATKLMAFALQRQRELSGLSQAEVAKRLGLKSTNGYQRYEAGEVQPALEKFFEMLNAMRGNRKVEVVLTSVKASGE